MKRNDFVRALKSKSIDVALAAKDSRLTDVDVAKADLDGDGTIKGKKELRALFTELDEFEGGRDRSRLALFAKEGDITAVGKAVAAIGDLAGAPKLAAPPLNDDILFVGMREANKDEERAIERATSAKVYNAGSASSIVKHGGTNFDMLDTAQIDAFAGSLGLPQAQATKVADAIKAADPDGRDELARIARIWAKGELGGRMPSRMVLSGHSHGDAHWGERGWLAREDVARLAEAMPKAAAKVEDLMLAGCGCGGPDVFADWQTILPNLKTIWGYAIKSPATGDGAEEHQARWEDVSQGRSQRMKRSHAKEKRSKYKTVVWTARRGFDDGRKRESIDAVRNRVLDENQLFQEYFSGKKTASDPSEHDLRQHYNHVRDLVQHPEIERAEKNEMKTRRDQTLLLLYWTRSVMPGFAKMNQALIEEGYREAGESKVPDYAAMNRGDAVREIDRFLAATEKSTSARVSDLRAALVRLRDLDTSNMPLVQ